MSQVDVRCTVNNCLYWTDPNACGAARILITSDSASRSHPGSADADWISMVVHDYGTTPASHAEATACKTFRAD